MRDLTKNMFRLSWAMSLYGVRQMGSFLDPRQVVKGSPDAADSLKEVSDSVVEQLGENLRRTFEVGEKIQGEIVDAMFGVLGPVTNSCKAPGPRPGSAVRPPIFDARSAAGETVMITYTRGTGTFSDSKQYIALNNPIYDLDGRENGLHEGVWEALFSNPTALLARPAPPVGPMDQAVGPVPTFPISANTIAKWTHADGSAISSVGPAASHLIPLSDGSFLFLVITAQIITEGTGRFAGARGLTQSLGATHVPAGVDFFAADGPNSFPATTLDTFKFVLSGGSGRGSKVPVGSNPSPASSPSIADAASYAAAPHPADSKFVEVHGAKMHYVDTGSGHPIVFLHGNPTWSYLWRNVLPHVSSRARCLAPDLIGMGKSDKPDLRYSFFEQVKYVEGFIEALDLDEYTLVLHDWGCIIGFYIAMRQESTVRGLAFMEAMFEPYASWDVFPKEVADMFQKFRTAGVGEQLILEQNVFVEQLLPASTTAKLSDEVMNGYRQPFLDAESRKVILAFTRSLPVGGQPAEVVRATGQYANWLKRTRLPKFLLWARPGLITTEKDVMWAQKNLENLKTSFVGEGLHFLQESHPVEIGQEIARWHDELG